MKSWPEAFLQHLEEAGKRRQQRALWSGRVGWWRLWWKMTQFKEICVLMCSVFRTCMTVSFSGGWMWRWRLDNSQTHLGTCWYLSCEVRRKEKGGKYHWCLTTSLWSLTSPMCWGRATPCSQCRSWDAPLSSDHWTAPGWSDLRVRSSSQTWANQTECVI